MNSVASCRQLSLMITPSCRQLSLARVNMKWISPFSLFADTFFRPRARKRHLTTTGIASPTLANIKFWRLK